MIRKEYAKEELNRISQDLIWTAYSMKRAFSSTGEARLAKDRLDLLKQRAIISKLSDKKRQ